MEKIRLSKLMSEQGFCSRREADSYIERGWVLVDGVAITELGTRILPTQTITLAPAAQSKQQARVTVLLNKPIGFVSAQPEKNYRPAIALVTAETQYTGDRNHNQQRFDPRHLRGLAPAGRLDIDSTGLLVLTQDGRIAKQLIGENSRVEKEYLVRVTGKVSKDGLAQLNHGLSLDGEALRPAEVSWQNKDQLRFVLRQGKKRQIRRMCEMVDLTVVGLKRVRIGKVMLSDLPIGQWRYLHDDETF
jgi:23S rRNA pseudouridine2604 synthase